MICIFDFPNDTIINKIGKAKDPGNEVETQEENEKWNDEINSNKKRKMAKSIHQKYKLVYNL